MLYPRLAVSALALVAAMPAFAQTFDLGTIVVDVEAENAPGYAGDAVELSTGTLLKSGAEIARTPRSVSVVTAQEIYARGADDVEEALAYTTGVNSGQWGLDDRSDWYTIRGFDPTTFHDGLQARYGYYNVAKPEPFLLDRVEVLRGPASGLYGNGDVGGIVNTESKTAANFSGDNLARLSFGSHEKKEVGLDLGGDLNASGTLKYRLVGLLRDAETQVDFSRNDARALAPSITWAPSDATEITLLYTHQENDGSPLIQFASIYGTLLPAPNGHFLDDSLFIGEPDFDRFDTTRDSVTLLADHRFSDVWSVSARARWLDGEADYRHAWWAFDDYPTRYNPDGTIDRTVYRAENSLQTLTLDAYATASWQAGVWDMQTVFGTNYADAEYDSDTGYGAQNGPVDPFDPVYIGTTDVAVVDTPANTVEEWGVYLQNNAVLNDRLHLDLGLRYGRIETGEASSPFSSAAVSAEDSAWIGNAALLYRFDNGLAPYVSYAESFRQEIVGEDAQGDPFEPTRGEQVEIGLKYQPVGTPHLYTVALWNLTKSNLTEADPVNPGFSVQTGEAQSHGIELGAVTGFGDFRFDVSATFLDTENVDGFTLANVPEEFGSIWGEWAPSSGGLNGLSVGAGIRYSGEKWDGTDSQKTPSYTLYDARLAYAWDSHEAQITATNLADEDHVSFCGTSTCYFGKGREVSVSLSTKF
ncbi:Ferric hydroxamate uptake [Jannaschia seosinensis]|uniref:Ferric hydroxamate uptake n=1 Tax=Jannaschia seosinensis TaxID=313367 RepID=A0A0M7BAR8_9RHOB|nr:TonB-dependent siderophore receptor [Jannaschia seosinensis]CUH39279.1 Ferric hydroxamate uptake [Jannaschia seosinensis]